MSLVEITREGAVALVRMNRPPVNALNQELSNDLLSAFQECQDPAVRAVVLTGHPNFSVGADIKGFLAQMEAEAVTDQIAGYLVLAIDELEKLEKPTIAAVHGVALGGGLELAMAADFRYLADNAKVGQPEILLGLIPGAGGTQRLTRLVGHQRSKELVLSGRQVAASEAFEIGLADKVSDAEGLLELAMGDATAWAAMATRAIGEVKRVFRETGASNDFPSDMQREAEAFQRLFGSKDAREGVKAFVEKRAPDFVGE